MTTRTAKLIQAIPKTKTMREAGRMAGYTSNDIYRKRIKTHIMEALKCEPDSVRKHFEGLYDKCMLKGDLSTAKGILDSICRITGMNQDMSTLNVRYAPDKVCITDFNSIHTQLTSKTPELSQKVD